MRILAISGSLRADSYNTALARAAAERAPEGAEIELYDRLGEIPPYDADVDGGDDAPEPALDLRRRIADADALLIVTPEYNGSVPGMLKNAIDWASRPPRGGAALWGKTVAVAGATTGQYGAIWAQQDLRRILGIAGARVTEGELPVAQAPTVFDESGRLRDPLLGERLRTHLENLAHEASAVALAA
jgi:chromate reductase, NAD(P)H dehydrogenase (quinone)